MTEREIFQKPDQLYKSNWIGVARRGKWVAWDDVANSGSQEFDTEHEACEFFSLGVVEAMDEEKQHAEANI